MLRLPNVDREAKCCKRPLSYKFYGGWFLRTVAADRLSLLLLNLVSSRKTNVYLVDAARRHLQDIASGRNRFPQLMKAGLTLSPLKWVISAAGPWHSRLLASFKRDPESYEVSQRLSTLPAGPSIMETIEGHSSNI